MRTDESSSTSMVSPKSPLSLPFPSRVVLTKIYSRPIVHTRVFVFLVLMNQIFPAQVCGMNRHAKARRTSITSTNRWSRTEYASRLMPHKPASFQLVVSLCKNSISPFFSTIWDTQRRAMQRCFLPFIFTPTPSVSISTSVPCACPSPTLRSLGHHRPEGSWK